MKPPDCRQLESSLFPPSLSVRFLLIFPWASLQLFFMMFKCKGYFIPIKTAITKKTTIGQDTEKLETLLNTGSCATTGLSSMKLVLAREMENSEGRKRSLMSYERLVSKKTIEEDVPRKMEKSTESLQEKSTDKKRTQSSHITALMILLRSISVEWMG